MQFTVYKSLLIRMAVWFNYNRCMFYLSLRLFTSSRRPFVTHSSVTCLIRCLVLANHGSKQGGRWESSFYLKEDFCIFHASVFQVFSCFTSLFFHSISTLHECEGPGCHRHFEPSGVAAGSSQIAALRKSRALHFLYWVQCCSVLHFLAAVGLVHVDQFRSLFHL